MTIAPPTSLAMLLSASLRSEVAATDVGIRPDPLDGAKAAADAMAAAKMTDFMVVLCCWDCGEGGDVPINPADHGMNLREVEEKIRST